ncbi:uncharacterized protein LOC121372037 [Gigantopelta aegis]|uniref:uncharacterized protein LOC121372037 n=1 Tax=Gigantopelta aegis TaxID=1735272 RepID=UPI001B889E2A|nr:uncharacterized protein LOC121372037 [Gigantopelta aegis]
MPKMRCGIVKRTFLSFLFLQMRFTCLLVLLVAFAVIHESHSWIYYYRRRAVQMILKLAAQVLIARKKAQSAMLRGKRDISEYDTNKDGVLDLDELEKVMSTRDAEDFLQFADVDGNSEVTVDEFRRVVRDLNERE